MVAGPIWLGDNSSVTKKVIERIYSLSSLLNEKGQYLFYGRVAGCLITGNEDGIKHCAQNVLYSLQHVGYTIPPNADAGWIGEAGPGPSYLDPGSGGPENDFTNRNTTFMTWNLMHLARMLTDGRGSPRLRQPALGVERRHPLRLGEPGVPLLTARDVMRTWPGPTIRMTSDGASGGEERAAARVGHQLLHRGGVGGRLHLGRERVAAGAGAGDDLLGEAQDVRRELVGDGQLLAAGLGEVPRVQQELQDRMFMASAAGKSPPPGWGRCPRGHGRARR